MSCRLPSMLAECSRVGLGAEPLHFDGCGDPEARTTQAHEHAWREWLASGPDERAMALFVEDDTRFLRDTALLEKIVALAPDDADFLFFGWHCWGWLPELRSLPVWFAFQDGMRANCCMLNCYALTPGAAREMLGGPGRDPQLKTDLRISWLSPCRKVYACAPLAAVCEKVGSNTSPNGPDLLIQGTAGRYVPNVASAYALNAYDTGASGPGVMQEDRPAPRRRASSRQNVRSACA